MPSLTDVEQALLEYERFYRDIPNEDKDKQAANNALTRLIEEYKLQKGYPID